MAFTDNCDIFAGVEEDAVNLIIRHIALQRPSLFNYGTESFVNNPDFMCHEIEVAPRLPANQPRVALQPPIPVPGTSGRYAMEYCAQLTKLKLDLHPLNQFGLPGELDPLADQSFAVQMEVCGGLACPSDEVLQRYALYEARNYPPIDPAAAIKGDDKAGRQELPSSDKAILLRPGKERIHCFCLELFATGKFVSRPGITGPEISIELTGLEIVDIKPDGLENSLECLLSATIALGVLPRIRFALNDVVLDLAEYGELTIGMMPTSAAIPFNPSVEDDRLSVFVDVDLV